MKTSVNRYYFEQAFKQADRDNFSYEGLGLLFDYLKEYEESTGEEIELDVIALCCEFVEQDWDDVASSYDIDLTECRDDDESIAEVRSYLECNTSVVGETNSGFIFAQF